MNLITNEAVLRSLNETSPLFRDRPLSGYYSLADGHYYGTSHSTTEYVQFVHEQEKTIIIVYLPEKNLYVSVKCSDQCTPTVKPYSCHSDNLDLTGDGKRWEGMVHDEVLYGLGTLYDNEGKREYYGFLMGDTGPRNTEATQIRIPRESRRRSLHCDVLLFAYVFPVSRNASSASVTPSLSSHRSPSIVAPSPQ